MGYTFNGTDQSIQIGAAGLDILTTRPITSAVLLDSATLRTSGNWQTVLGNGSDSTSKGWFWRITTAGVVNVKYFVSGGNGEYTTTASIAPNTGRHLISVVIRTTGANTIINVYFYSYRTQTWTREQSGNLNNGAILAPGAGDVTMLAGGNNFTDYVPGTLYWVGGWNADFSNVGQTRPPAIAALIERGGWEFLDPTCKLFLPLSLGLVDYAAPLRALTLFNAPTLAPPLLTEPAPIPRFWFVDVASAFNPTQTVTETASGVDASTQHYAATIAETGSGADASTQQYAGTVAESGAGVDTPTGLIASSATDTASGADASSQQYQFSVSETGAGADADSGAYASTVSETGSGADAVSVQGGFAVTDSASGSDASSAQGAGEVGETGSGTDAPTGLIAATVADSATGADAVSTSGSGTGSSSDDGTGVDASSSLIASAATDSATGAELPAGFIVISLADVAFAVDLAFIGPFPPTDLPYQGDAYLYDSAGGIGPISGGTVMPGPSQTSATGSISGGTVLPPETIL